MKSAVYLLNLFHIAWHALSSTPVLNLPPSSITSLTVMLAALNFVLGASIRRLWALRTQRKTIECDVFAPVVLALSGLSENKNIV